MEIKIIIILILIAIYDYFLIVGSGIYIIIIDKNSIGKLFLFIELEKYLREKLTLDLYKLYIFYI